MEEHIVKILGIEQVTHNVKRFKVEKPAGYSFIPGQATDVAINKPGYEKENHPFTFTGLNEWENLEFTIKIYTDHDGVTKKLGTLIPGDELIIHDVWGAINYKDPGIFIAGGAGVTPFIAILRDLKKKNKIEGNKLFFSNRTSSDIILNDELKEILGMNFHNVLTRENNERINEEFLKEQVKDFSTNFYVCGPDSFVNDINNTLLKLGASTNSLIFEK